MNLSELWYNIAEKDKDVIPGLLADMLRGVFGDWGEDDTYKKLRKSLLDPPPSEEEEPLPMDEMPDPIQSEYMGDAYATNLGAGQRDPYGDFFLEKPQRDLQYMLNTREVYERDPRIREKLQAALGSVGEANEQQRQRQIQESLSNAIGPDGKVSPEAYLNLKGAGINLPERLIAPTEEERAASGMSIASDLMRQGASLKAQGASQFNKVAIQQGDDLIALAKTAREMAAAGKSENEILSYVLAESEKILGGGLPDVGSQEHQKILEGSSGRKPNYTVEYEP